MYELTIRQLLARNLKLARKRLNISQMELAHRSNLSTSYIGEIELGRKFPSAESLERLSKSLHIRPYQLFLDESEWNISEQLDLISQLHQRLRENIAGVLEETFNRFIR